MKKETVDILVAVASFLVLGGLLYLLFDKSITKNKTGESIGISLFLAAGLAVGVYFIMKKYYKPKN